VADKSLRSFVRLASILSARIIPARGGETEYVSTRLAFARLDAASRNKLQNSFAWHDYAHSRKQIAPDLASPEERAALPPQCWRMAWTNHRGWRRHHAFAVHAGRGIAAPSISPNVDRRSRSAGIELS
jgi:alpha-ketoglutarate-dependent 2,4-dichlorophenoxyacetate dioxygenase